MILFLILTTIKQKATFLHSFSFSLSLKVVLWTCLATKTQGINTKQSKAKQSARSKEDDGSRSLVVTTVPQLLSDRQHKGRQVSDRFCERGNALLLFRPRLPSFSFSLSFSLTSSVFSLSGLLLIAPWTRFLRLLRKTSFVLAAIITIKGGLCCHFRVLLPLF